MKIITDLSAMHRTIGNLLSRQRTVPCVTDRRMDVIHRAI